jgi:uncharacterized membrane protein YgcG
MSAAHRLCPSRRTPARSAFVLAALVLPALGPALRAEPKPLTRQEKEAINQAIDKGVDYLKASQQLSGSWASPEGQHQVGYAALPALTLLECGVPPDDPAVKRAADLVRLKGGSIDATYEVALSILFLDRLGDPKDKKLIQVLALRLVAGQGVTGGWGYKCPVMTQRHHDDLMLALRSTEPASRPVDLSQDNPDRATSRPADVVPDKGTRPDSRPAEFGDSNPYSRDPSLKTDPNASPSDGLGRAVPLDESRRSPRFAWCLRAQEPPPVSASASDKQEPAQPKKPFVIPAHLRDLIVFQKQERLVMIDPAGRMDKPLAPTTDNSNSQFAILALWAARRHDVPLSRTLSLVARRYDTSQNADGSWDYHYRPNGPDGHPAMTAVGLLGLAVGHGLADAGADKKVQDRRVANGFAALSRLIGHPAGRMQQLPQTNLYMLWSIERVAVLYSLPEVGGKDWYRWGAEMLVANQAAAGNWTNGGYWGSAEPLDTSFALLFLKRANLAKDLTSRLPIDPKELDRDVADKLGPISGSKQPAPDQGDPVKPADKTDDKPADKTDPSTVNSSKGADASSTSGSSSGANSRGGSGGSGNSGGSGGSGGVPLWALLLVLVGVLLLGGGVALIFLQRRNAAHEG